MRLSALPQDAAPPSGVVMYPIDFSEGVEVCVCVLIRRGAEGIPTAKLDALLRHYQPSVCARFLSGHGPHEGLTGLHIRMPLRAHSGEQFARVANLFRERIIRHLGIHASVWGLPYAHIAKELEAWREKPVPLSL